MVGDAGNLILGDGRPTLTQKWSGDIIITEVPPSNEDWNTGISHRPSYGYCTVWYPEVIASQHPPLVFGVPTAASTDKGLGYFCHRGSAGGWTGFSVLVTRRLFGQTSPASVGFSSGWQYRVCVFGEPGVRRSGATGWGLETMADDGTVTFNSDWPFVPFLTLLDSWRIEAYTRNYDVRTYFGNVRSGGSVDHVLAKGTHTWGAADGTKGVLLSGLGVIPTRHDTGNTDITSPGIVTIGFDSTSRSRIWSVVFQGRSQHPSGDVSAMNNWRLLTADFSYV